MRDSITPRDVRLAVLAARQHGIVSLDDLRALGFDRHAIARRVASGRLHRRYRGVYSVGHTVLSPHGHWLAAVLACGPDAALSHRSAAALWGLRPSAATRIDVTVPHTSGVRSTAAIAVHRSRRPLQATTHEAIPVTTPMRTLADLAMALPRRPLEKAAEAAEALNLLDFRALDTGHPGSQRLREVLEGHDLSSTTRSKLEDALLVLCDEHGLPRPLVNTIRDGVELDFCWPAHRLNVETDGRRHATRAAFERDRVRDARLTLLGWRVVRLTYRQVETQPAWVAALLRGLLSGRSPSLATP